MLTAKQRACLTAPSVALLKRANVDAVDVATYCDKLCLAITQPRNIPQSPQGALQRKQQGELITFRFASKLYHDTLLVYKQQVDNLLERSKMLLARSQFDLSHLLGSKRKSTKSGGKAKRRCLRETSIDFSELLQESEHLQQWSQLTIDEESLNYHEKGKRSNARMIQIREITICEINTEEEPDDDSGFGNATSDELNSYVQLFSEDHRLTKSPTVKKTIKRKAINDSNFSEKMPRLNESAEGLHSNDSIEGTRLEESNKESHLNYRLDDSIEMPRLEAAKSSNSQTAFDIDLNANSSSDEELNLEINTLIKELDRESPESNGSVGNHQVENILNYEIPLPLSLDTPIGAPKRSTKVRKLILDNRTMLTEAEMRAQINHPKPEKILFSRVLLKRRNIARELLATFKRDPLNLAKRIVKRRRLEQAKISEEYLQLLAEVLQRDIDEELACDVYKNWRGKKPKAQLSSVALGQMENDCVGAVLMAECNNNPDKENLPERTQSLNDSSNGALMTPYVVMMKLLDMWRYSSTDGVIMKQLFPRVAVGRKEAASGFYALLVLAAKNFIALTHAPNSIEIHDIKLGVASLQLIEQTKSSS